MRASIESERNTYDPYKRIGLITKSNLRHKNIRLGEMFDIYNDVRYLVKNHPSGKIEDELLRPMLYAMMGIFANTMLGALKKVYSILVGLNHSGRRQALLYLASNLENVYSCHRQFGVNCGFGDFDESDSEIEYFSPEMRDAVFDRIITAENIKSMLMFQTLKADYDFFISVLTNFVNNNPFFTGYFGTELSPANFYPHHSVYGYLIEIIEKL
jgi:hypothetical protein